MQKIAPAQTVPSGRNLLQERNPAKCERFAERLRDNQRNLERDPIMFNLDHALVVEHQ